MLWLGIVAKTLAELEGKTAVIETAHQKITIEQVVGLESPKRVTIYNVYPITLTPVDHSELNDANEQPPAAE